MKWSPPPAGPPSCDPVTTARAVFHATARFHDPSYAPVWRQPDVEAQFEAVVELVLRGLRRPGA
ncbi:hypothetical protein [Streptomyces sp. NPDC012510]|uniref:hypothetical protein n=1 Tax=Streptomyces sp. NPDC012510 TaxID=3364838 RepID=UPI0036E26AB8